MLAPVEALDPIPHSLRDVDAAPMLCAGVATYNALRHAGALPGDLVAVQGIDGLGHLGIQFANKFGYKVAAVGRGSQIETLAKRLGADVYIDSKVKNPAEELQKLGAQKSLSQQRRTPGHDRLDWRAGSEWQASLDRCHQ